MTVGLSSLDKPCVIAFYPRNALLTRVLSIPWGSILRTGRGASMRYFRTAKASMSTRPCPPTTITLTVRAFTLENFLLQMTWR